jgi:hypothetical protein
MDLYTCIYYKFIVFLIVNLIYTPQSVIHYGSVEIDDVSGQR